MEIRITDTISSKLEPMVLDGQLDFAVVIPDGGNPKILDYHLMDDQVYLCVANSLLEEYYGQEAAGLKERAIHGANLKEFDRLPFCLLSNRMGRQVQECFNEARVTPRTYLTSTYTQISTSICFQRLAACFASQMNLANQRSQIPEDINIFPLLSQGVPLTQHLSLIRHRDRYLSHYSKLFLELLFQYFAEVEQIQLDRIAGPK